MRQSARMLRNIFITSLLAMLTACAAQTPTYDSAAVESRARIVSKTIAGEKIQPRADSFNAGPGVAATLGAAGLLLADVVQKKASVTVYEYLVKSEAGEEVRVSSEYFAFSVGDCVTLFQSPQPTYPRIAWGSGCK